MHPHDEVAAVLKRYLQVEEATVNAIATEIEGTSDLGQVKAAAKRELLNTLELHHQADDLLEAIVAKYREDLYIICRRLAEDDLEAGIVTRSHVRRAQAALARKRARYGWGDALLATGGLLAGAAIPHIIDIASVQNTSPRPVLLVIGVIGALLFGMGVVDKAKS